MSSVARHAFAQTRATAIAGMMLAVLGTAAHAQAPVPSEADIVKALTPKPVTRSLSTGALSTQGNPADESFIREIQNRPNRSLSRDDRSKLAAITTTRPRIDLEIPFDYDSATIGPRTAPAVDRLGAALSRPEIKGGTFLIGGHTDGKGGDAYNQGLSERRAEAVRSYIVEKFKIEPKSLISVGYGKSQMKNSGDPFAEENRRVEVTNLADVKSAAR